MYLHEFLHSLANQKDVAINLIVSDDGSRDQTLAIIEQNRSKFNSLTILEGPQKGPAQNFLHLLRHSTADFAAFADQDDIWDESHLANSIKRLERHSAIPALSFSAITRFFENGQPSEVWPVISEIPQLSQIYIECPALGCTMVLNRPAIDLVNSYRPTSALMHDRWCLLIMMTSGDVVFGSQPEIRYRIHARNVSGLGKRSALVTLRKIRDKEWQPYLQITELYRAFAGFMTESAKNEMKEFIDALEGGITKRLTALVFTRKRFREEMYNELRTRVAFLFFPLLFNRKRDSTKL